MIAEVDTNVLATSMVVVINTCVGAVVTVYLAKLNAQAKKADGKVEDVRTTLETSTTKVDRKLSSIEKVNGEIHTLVNSNFGVQLELNARLARKMSNFTQRPEDIADAEAAEAKYEDHQRKQGKVDRGEKTL